MDNELLNIITSKLLSLDDSLNKLHVKLQNICIEIKTLNQVISHSSTLDTFFSDDPPVFKSNEPPEAKK